MKRRQALEVGLAAGAALALSAATLPARAQAGYPSRPLRIVVPSAVGVAPDIMARLFAQKLSESLGQPVIVDAKPGASGIIGTDLALKGPADGYTLLYGYNQLVSLNPHLFSKLPYDAQRDMQPVTLLATGGYVLLADPAFPANNVSELIALARTKPRSINYASYGPGTFPHLVMELLASAGNIELTHIPYKNSPVPDLMAGQVQLAFEPNGSALPFVKSGKVKALGVSYGKRLPQLPEVPTLAETLPGVEAVGWHGVWVPAGTPPPIVERLHRELVKILKSPEMSKRFTDLSFDIVGNSPAEMAAWIRKESEQWGRVIKAKKIQLD